MPAATSQTYRVQTGVMYTNDQYAGVSQPKDASVTRTLPSSSTVSETVQTKVIWTADADLVHVNDVAGQYSTVSVVNIPTQPRLNY